MSTRSGFIEQRDVASLEVLRSRVEGALRVGYLSAVSEAIGTKVARVAAAQAIDGFASDCRAVTEQTSLSEGCAHAKSGEKKTDPGFVHQVLIRASVCCCELLVVQVFRGSIVSLVAFFCSNLVVTCYFLLVLR